MSDIVDRLRNECCDDHRCVNVREEAADEIERLRTKQAQHDVYRATLVARLEKLDVGDLPLHKPVTSAVLAINRLEERLSDKGQCEATEKMTP